MNYNYPHGSMQDMNLDWLLQVGKQAHEDHEEWSDIKGTAQKMIDDAIQDSLDSGEIEKVVDEATQKVITEQIEPLEKTVTQNTTDISNLEKKFGQLDLSGKTIFVGDSYAEGWTTTASGGSNVTPWINYVVSACGITDYEIVRKGGSGFAVGGNQFIDLIRPLENSQNVKNIVVCGGYNEPADISALRTNINSFCALAKSKFPNCRIFCGMIGWDVNSEQWDRLRIVTEGYNAPLQDWFYLNNVQYSIHSDGLMGMDGFHPNQNGYEAIGNAVAQALKTGSCNPSFFNVNANITWDANWSLASGATWNFVTDYDGNKSRIIWTSTVLTPVSNKSFKADGSEILLCALSSTSYIGDGAGYSVFPTNVVIQNGDGKFYNCPAQFHFMGRQLYMSLHGASPDGTDYLTFTGVKQVQIPRGSLVE